MNCTIIFNYLNDIIYLNPSDVFLEHVSKLAESQGLKSTRDENTPTSTTTTTPSSSGGSKLKYNLDPNIIIQLYSPLVTSHRFMSHQFGNTYSSIQCQDGTNIVFLEQNDYLYVQIGVEDIDYLRRLVGVCQRFALYITGADTTLLKNSPSHSTLLDDLILCWKQLYSSNQLILFEALEQSIISDKLNQTMIRNLRDISNKIGSSVHSNAIIFLNAKLIAWHSTRNALHLQPDDLLFLNLLCQKSWGSQFTNCASTPTPGSSKGTPVGSRNLFSPTASMDAEKLRKNWLQSYLILFQSENNFIPHHVIIGQIQEGFYLVLVIETITSLLTASLSKALQLSNEFHSTEREILQDKAYFELLESTTKRILDLMKKHKQLSYRKDLLGQFDKFKNGFSTYIKSRDARDVQIVPCIEIFREALRSTFLIENNPPPKTIESIWRIAKADLSTQRSSALFQSTSIQKYLEHFPGLVYFIYIDRNKHLATMPSYEPGDGSIRLNKKKIWTMVEFARAHMQEGHFSLMWKDSSFNYAYFLWFEDAVSGSSLRPPNHFCPLPFDAVPGILCGNFYKNLVFESFGSGVSLSKIRTHEIFCIHMGLATSFTVLEASKRLASTIWEITGTGQNTTDIL